MKMNLRPTLISLILVAACMSGCAPQSVVPTDAAAAQPEVSAPKSKMPTLLPIDDVPALAEDSLRAVEQKYSCQLPDDYFKFLLKNNGGFPSPDCVSFKEGGRKTASDVFCFFS